MLYVARRLVPPEFPVGISALPRPNQVHTRPLQVMHVCDGQMLMQTLGQARSDRNWKLPMPRFVSQAACEKLVAFAIVSADAELRS